MTMRKEGVFVREVTGLVPKYFECAVRIKAQKRKVL